MLKSERAADFVRDYLTAIENNAVVGRETEWYTLDAVQVEFPNKLLPMGATRDLSALKQAGERGRAIVASQFYEITNIVEQGNQVAVEAIFRATFKIDLPELPRGKTMTAHFAMFFEMRNGKIARHHTYDCFDPLR
jgi:ketosteroid isomerase-like protein